MKSTISGILFLVLLSATMVLYVAHPNPQVASVCFLFTLAAAGAWGWFSRKSVGAFFLRKSTRYGANVAFILFLLLGIITFVNVLGTEYSWRKDITRFSVNSLSPQTLKILQTLPQPVKAYYFSSVQEKERGEPMIKNYAHESSKFTYEFVDTARRPTFVQTMDVKKNDTVVLTLGDTNKRVKVDGVSEEKLTNGLIQLLRTREQVVYFVSGHGERALEGADPLGYSALNIELTKQGYTVKELPLFTEGKIPADAAVVVVAGASRAFFPKELDLLKDWLAKGGRALFALDLNPAENGLAKGSRELAELLKPYGIEASGRMLVDPLSKAANVEPQVLLGFSASREHPITKDFPMSNRGANFLFPLTTNFNVKTAPGFVAAPLVNTSPAAWAEGSWQSLKSGAVTFNAAEDLKGQMALAYAVESENKKTKLVVFGTSTFASTSLLDQVGNRDLFLNSVAWLADDEQLISIRARDEGEGLQQFDANMLNLVLLVSVFLLPAALVLAGVVVWLRRSKL